MLVTSRAALGGLAVREGARRIVLTGLSEDDATTLLRQLLGKLVDGDPAASSELIERCARLPLAMRIAAESINARPARSMGALAAELADQRSALDALAAGDDPAADMRAVFSWSYKRLSSAAALVFRLMGLHRGHDMGRDAVVAMSGDTGAAVDELLRAHLLDEPAADRYRMHDLLRAYAAELSRRADPPARRRAAATSLGEHYVRAAAGERTDLFADGTDALAWFDLERSNLVGVATGVATRGERSATIPLAGALRRYLSLGGHHDEALELSEAAVRAARGPVEEGNACRYLGSVHRRLGRLEQAYEYMHRAYRCYERAEHGRYLQIQLNNLGVTCTWLGRFDEALRHLRRARDLSAESGADGHVTRIGALTYLGQAYVYRGEPETAIRYLSAALADADDGEIRERIDGEAIIGFAYEGLARFERAREHLERAWSMALDTGNRFIQAYVVPLAHVYWQLGLVDAAFDCAEHCLAIVHRDREYVAELGVRNTFGELCLLGGRLEESLEHHRTASDMAEASAVPREQARAHAGIAETGWRLGEHAAARAHWRRALEIYRTLGCADAVRVRRRLAAVD